MIKFLIIRFSSIGDIVLTTPVIRCLKQQIEEAEIHFLTKKPFASIVSENPYVDHVHTIERHTGEILPELQKIDFDHIIDLHKNLRSSTIKKKLKIPAFSFNKLNIEKWLLVNFKKNKMPDLHIVDRYMQTIRIFDVVNDQNGLDYFIPKTETDPTEDLPSPFRKEFIAFSIGANHATKRMPTEKVIEFIKYLNLPVVILGGKDTSEDAQKIATECKEKVFDATGKYTLNQSALFLKKSRFVITYDTGLMHIASALKKDIISIWGNTVPEFGMTPYLAGERSHLFDLKLPCRPCSKIGYKKCPKGHFKCMNDQNIKTISSYANGL